MIQTWSEEIHTGLRRRCLKGKLTERAYPLKQTYDPFFLSITYPGRFLLNLLCPFVLTNNPHKLLATRLDSLTHWNTHIIFWEVVVGCKLVSNGLNHRKRTATFISTYYLRACVHARMLVLAPTGRRRGGLMADLHGTTLSHPTSLRQACYMT